MVFRFCWILSQILQFLNLNVNMWEMGFKSKLLVFDLNEKTID